MSVDALLDDVIEREGGYVNHPADRGGATKYGVTLQTLRAWRKRRVTAEDVKRLSKDEAKAIFKSRYFDEPKISRLPVELHDIMLDMSVHHGPNRAIKLLQKTILWQGIKVGLDGLIGPQTIGAAQECLRNIGKVAFINAIADSRIAFFRRIVDDDPSQKVFLSGWINRAEKFKAA